MIEEELRLKLHKQKGKNPIIQVEASKKERLLKKIRDMTEEELMELERQLDKYLKENL